jgi:hypothetical protein
MLRDHVLDADDIRRRPDPIHEIEARDKSSGGLATRPSADSNDAVQAYRT